MLNFGITVAIIGTIAALFVFGYEYFEKINNKK